MKQTKAGRYQVVKELEDGKNRVYKRYGRYTAWSQDERDLYVAQTTRKIQSIVSVAIFVILIICYIIFH